MYVNDCGYCYKPATRRLALFNTKDEYHCYAEGYVKCFWGLCGHHKSLESLVKKATPEVITRQPLHQVLPYKTPGIIQSVLDSY